MCKRHPPSTELRLICFQNYNFGHSQVVDKATLKHELHAKIGKALETGPLFLVFHDSSQDIKYV